MYKVTGEGEGGGVQHGPQIVKAAITVQTVKQSIYKFYTIIVNVLSATESIYIE